MIDNILVIDDVISKEKQDLLENLLINNPDFPWYFIKDVTSANSGLELKNYGRCGLIAIPKISMQVLPSITPMSVMK